MLLSGFTVPGELDRLLATVAAASLLPLACYILVSGLDDLVLDLAGLWRTLTRRAPRRSEPRSEAAIAIFIPCWHESGVIADMLRHNLASISYSNYEIFAGAYPNDMPTAAAIRSVQATHPRLHLTLVPHDGPTSKADCLNRVYQSMHEWEAEHARTFDIVVIHDAEDVIHPSSLRLYNRYAAEGYGMIQLPVLALPAGVSELTYGAYCDDFAESQSSHLETRNRAGAFLPGCGVGTAFSRDALTRLAEANGDFVFDPGSLTEDYDTGLRLHRLGVRQMFIPLTFERNAPVATREYFPRGFGQAVRQRSRWVTGNALQAWEGFGWGGSLRDKWFLWRDRKGLWGNPLSLYCNMLLIYGLCSGATATIAGEPWRLGELVKKAPLTDTLLYITTGLFATRVLFRVAAAARVYGWLFAAGVPLRMVWGNLINCAATGRALLTWTLSRLRRTPLVWVKTEHAYPSRGALVPHKRILGEILVAKGYCQREQVREALATRTGNQRIGERLLAMGTITEEALYEAISAQQSMPVYTPVRMRVSPRVARALPANVVDGLQMLPFRVERGEIFIAGPDIPDDRTQRTLQRFTSLEPRFHLITPTNYNAMRAAALDVYGPVQCGD